MTEGGAPEGMWSSPQDLVGTTLADRYQVTKVIGDGGMGSVFLGEHITLRKKVALKVLHPELCRDQTQVDRFLQEARAASMINHENIVDIVDFGNVPGGSVFFAMEFLQGQDLAGTLRRDGRMTWPRVQAFMLQIVRALAAAHDKGIIHRDLKPANCFVINKSDGREFIKLLDFGIAKVTDAENDKGLTRTGAVFGTAKYMAPEQACGEPADRRTDIYAAAVLMYELLTGTVPFEGDNFMRVLSQHLTEPLELPSTRCPDAGIPPMVESIVVKALSKKREDRYQTMNEFEEALLALGPDGTLKAGGMGAAAYSANMTNPGGGPGATLPLEDAAAPGNTMWLGQGSQGSVGPASQPPEGRGGTMMLDGDSVPPEFLNQGTPQGPTGWSHDAAAPGGTMMIDGMGQDILPHGQAAAAITQNPPMMGGARPITGAPPGMGHAGTNPPPGMETSPPLGGGMDATYGGVEFVDDDEARRKKFIMIAVGGGLAALVLGGLVAFLLAGGDPEEDSSEKTAQVTKTESNTDVTDDPETKDDGADGEGQDDAAAAEGGDDDNELTIVDEGGAADGGQAAADGGDAAADGGDDGGAADEGDDGGDDGSIEVDPEPQTPTDPKTPKNTTRPTPSKVKDVRSPKDISKGFSRANSAAKACGKKFGAIPGQSIPVEVTIKPTGAVGSAKATGPSRSTPLAKCVASAVQKKAKFVASKQAFQIANNSYKM